MVDVSGFSQTAQAIASTVTVLGVLVGLGMLIQNLRTIGRVLDKLDERVDLHITDRKVHPDVPDLTRRIRALEAARAHNHDEDDEEV